MVLMLPVATLLVILEPYRLQRLLAFLDPSKDPLNTGYQINQSLIAVGSGGWLGKGLMAGVQKLFYIPEPHTDFIFAVIGEELGLIGTTAVVICFAVLCWRGLRASVLAPDRFGALLALGLTTMVAVQAFVNISVVIGIAADQGHPAAAREQRRIVAAHQPGRAWASCSTFPSRPRARPGAWRSRREACVNPRSLGLLIAGGGTGGHLYPGLAVAREMVRRVPDANVTFVGTARGLESTIVPREGFALDVIRSAGLKGKSMGARVARRGSAAGERDGRVARDLVPAAVGGDGRRRLQRGAGRAPGRAAPHPDDGARAERGAGRDQPAAGALGRRRGGHV